MNYIFEVFQTAYVIVIGFLMIGFVCYCVEYVVKLLFKRCVKCKEHLPSNLSRGEGEQK